MTSKADNTSVYSLVVSFEGSTFTPIISVHDCGTWKIEGHEAMCAAVGEDFYSEWLCNFWADVRSGRAKAGACTTTCLPPGNRSSIHKKGL